MTTFLRQFLCRLATLLLCFLVTFKSQGQLYFNQRPEFIKANSQWALYGGDFFTGIGTGLDFNTTPATTMLSVFPSGSEGIASVADPVTGVLLFYSDGGTCWNAGNQIMLNGDSLLGNSGPELPASLSTTQGVCIVPFIDQPGKYYLFSLDGTTSWFGYPQPDTPFLYYSVIDMSLDGGLGGIVPGQKNIPLGGNTPLGEGMIAIPGDNCDIWLMVHDYINPVFKAFHITRQGIDPNPVVSTAGTQLQGNAGYGAYIAGGMAVSPDRKTIGISSCDFFTATPGSAGIVLCKFDPATGTVGNSLEVEEALTSYTLVFSPDNTKLYLCNTTDNSFTLPSLVVQYDISVFNSAAIAASKMTVGQISYPTSGYLKSYDGKIYLIPTYSPDSLFVINQPDLPGTACDFQPYLYNNPLGLTFNGYSLPNDVVYAFPPDTLSIREYTGVCTRNQILEGVTLTAPAGYNSYAWDDGSTNAIRGINAPGTYWVLCKDSCHSLVDSIVVTAKDIPLSLGPDTTLCNAAALILNAAVSGGSYIWQDSSTNSAFATADSGLFWVRVSAQGCTVSDTIVVRVSDLRQDLGEDVILCKGDPVQTITLQANVPDGATVQWSTGSTSPSIVAADTGLYWIRVEELPCTGSDTIRIIPEVCACRVGIPNAFSPNGDGQNDAFLPVMESGCAVRSYVLNIYNRYGARIYSGHNPDEGWNGHYTNGAAADVGTYMYEIIFTGGTQEIKYYRKGDLVLIR